MPDCKRARRVGGDAMTSPQRLNSSLAEHDKWTKSSKTPGSRLMTTRSRATVARKSAGGP